MLSGAYLPTCSVLQYHCFSRDDVVALTVCVRAAAQMAVKDGTVVSFSPHAEGCLKQNTSLKTKTKQSCNM